MRKTTTAAIVLLGSLTALPAMAQTAWTGNRLIVQGATTNGCNIEVVRASYRGSGEIMLSMRNLGGQTVRASGDTLLEGDNQSKIGWIRSLAISAGGQSGTNIGTPFGGPLAGTRLRVNITSCVRVT